MIHMATLRPAHGSSSTHPTLSEVATLIGATRADVSAAILVAGISVKDGRIAYKDVATVRLNYRIANGRI